MAESRKREVCVFLSSTFRDMQEERFRLATNTFQQLRFMCERRGINFSVVDLRWGITEEESHGGEVLRRCLNEIDRCRPYFVCLLGERYGWCKKVGESDALLQTTFDRAVRDGHSWLERYRDRSVTELEIIYGALEPEHAGGAKAAARSVLLSSSECEAPRALAFLRNELYATKKFDIGDERRADFESESESHHRRLAMLKERIRTSPQSISYCDYDDPADLTAKCLRELTALLLRDFPELAEEADGDEHASVATPRELHKQAVQQCAIQSRLFVGRTKLLRSLADACKRKNAKQPNSIIAVAGKSGSGLSSLASAFCTQSQAAFDVFPVFAGTRPELRVSGLLLRELELVLKETYDIGLPVPDDEEGAVKHFSAWLQAVHRELQRQGQGRKALLVLDGLDKVTDRGAHALRWLPGRIPSNIRIVVTSAATLDDQEHPVVSALHTKEAVVFALEHLSDQERRKYAESYLAQYGKKMSQAQMQAFIKHPCTGMPRFAQVVLNQLACYGTFDTLGDQLRRYLTAHDFASLYGLMLHDWESAYDGGREKALVSRALKALYVLSGGISEVELMNAVAVKSIADWAPFFQVLRGSLTLLPDGKFALFNQHLRSAVKDRFLNSTQKLRTAQLSMASFLESRPYTCELTLDELPALLVQVIRASSRSTVAGSVSRLINFLSDLNVLLHMYNGGRRDGLFAAWGEVRIAQGPSPTEVYDRALQRRGKNCPRASLIALAHFYHDVGEFSAAVAIAQRLVASDRVSFGRDALELGESNLLGAQNAMKGGDFDNAVKLATVAQQVFSKARKREGREELLKAKMAQFSFLAGGGAAGDSPALLGAIQSLAVVAGLFKKRGEYEAAAAEYGRAIALADELKHGDAEVARLYSLAGDVSRKLGDYDEAERAYSKSVGILANAFGDYHPDVVAVQRSIALVQKKRGNYALAQELYRSLLNTLSTVFGERHYQYGVILNEYADVYRKMAEYNRAKPLYREALDVIEHSLGPEHPEMVDPLFSLGRLLKTEGAYVEARVMYERAIEIVERVFGVDHFKYTQLLTAIGDVERKCGNYDRAEVMYLDALEALETSLGPAHIELADVLNSLGLVCKKLAKYDQARRSYERAMSIVEQHLGKAHLKYGVLMTNLGDVSRKEGRSQDALRELEAAHETLERAVGKEHSEVAEVLHSIGKVYGQMGQQSKSSSFFERAIRMVADVLGPAHPKVGFYTNSLGEALQLSSPDEALQKYKSALALLQKALGKGHPEVADVWTNMGHCQVQLHNKSAAAASYNEAVRIVYEVLGMEHPKFDALCKAIAKVGGTVSVGVHSLKRSERKGRARAPKRAAGGARSQQDSIVQAVAAMQVMGWI